MRFNERPVLPRRGASRRALSVMLGEIAGDADRADELAIDEVLSSFYTRTRLTQREFVIATGHRSRSRTNRVSA